MENANNTAKTRAHTKTTTVKLAIMAVFAGAALLFIGGRAGPAVMALLGFDKKIDQNAQRMLSEGRETFRSDTFGDEADDGMGIRGHVVEACPRPNHRRAGR